MSNNKRSFSNVKWKINGHSVILGRALAAEQAYLWQRPSKIMSPRPRETSDAEILAATARAMQRYSPTQLTLAHVAKEAGVVPATLIQRFGTKRGLLLAVCSTAPAGVPEQFAAARTKHKSPLKALVELYVACSGFASTPESMANGLAYLQNDLTDPEFRAVTLAQFRALRSETRKLLDEAVAARELVKCDTAELARLIQQVNGGSMLDWAVFREGSLAAWLRRDLESLLRPYRSGHKNSSPITNKNRRKRAP
jgi:AcrR family transcriptional regulator